MEQAQKEEDLDAVFTRCPAAYACVRERGAMDNALAECAIGLYKTEVLRSDFKQSLVRQRINQIGPWKSMREVEWETLKWPYGPSRGLPRQPPVAQGIQASPTG